MKTKGIAACVVTMVVFFCASLFAANAAYAATKTVVVRTKVQAAIQKTYRRLDGVPAQKKVANRWPIAVMIDSFVTARPQAGLQDASIVYEALAEGGIPRFMAVFADRTPKLIGPVRSTRPYFLRYAAEYPAALAHAGGSYDAQKLLHDLRLVNIEGVKGKTAKYFFRLHKGNGVHDLYTTGALLDAAMRQTSVNTLTPNYQAWPFVGGAALKKRGAEGHGVSTNIGAGKSYDIRYVYDRKGNVYQRFTGGKPQMDRNTGKQVTVKNVVLLLVPKERVLDRKGHLDISNLGKGKAIVLQNGHAITVNWSKPNVRNRLVLTTNAGKPVSFLRGSVWVTVVPKGHPYKVF